MDLSKCNDLLLAAIAARLGMDPEEVDMEFTGDKDEVSFLFTAKDGRRMSVNIDYME